MLGLEPASRMYAFAPSCPSGPKKASSACHGCYFRTFHAPDREMLSRASGLFDKALLEGVRGDSLMTFAQQMAAWSVFDEAAQSANATSDRPSSNSRLPRRDWQ